MTVAEVLPDSRRCKQNKDGSVSCVRLNGRKKSERYLETRDRATARVGGYFVESPSTLNFL